MMIKKNRGESLIELLVSIGLLTLIAVVFLYIFSYVTKLNISTEEKISATYICEQRAEYLYSTSFEVRMLSKNALLNELVQEGFVSYGPLLDDVPNRWYSPEPDDSGTGTCKMYKMIKENTDDDEYPGYTETISIWFNYYYGNLSKVIIETEKDDDRSKIETIFSWVN